MSAPRAGASAAERGGAARSLDAATKRRAVLAGAGLLLLGLVAILRLELVLDISTFMLGEGSSTEARLSRTVATSDLTRTLTVLVKAEDTGTALAASRALEAEIRSDPALFGRLEAVEGGAAPGLEEAMWSLYRPRLLSFVGRSATEATERLQQAEVGRALDALSDRLGSPASALIARVAPQDPLLVLPRLFEALADSGRGGIRVVDDRFVSRDGRHGVLFVRTRAPALRGAEQAPVLEGLRDAFARVERSIPGLELKMAGLHRFSAKIERSIKADITRVSILSGVALTALVLLLFRSFRIVLLTFTVVGSGMIVGLFATLVAFGRIHGLTLAFGSSLIGVSIDYSVHFFVHHVLGEDEAPPRKTLARLAPGLLLGALTTVAGFVALGTSSLPGLSEVAVFAAAGILGALFATFQLVPALMPKAPHRPTPRALADLLHSGLTRLQAAPGWARLFPLGLAAVAAVLGLPSLRFNDDVARLARLDPDLVAEEEAVRAEVSPFEQRRFVMAVGASVEEALEVNDRIAEALGRAETAGELTRFRNLSSLLPSARTQREVEAAVRGIPDLAARVRAAAKERGFRPEAFDPFEALLAAEGPPPLTLEDLRATPLRGLVEAFVLDLSGGPTSTPQVGILSLLGGVERPEALADRLRAVTGAVLLDQSRLYHEANRRHRARTGWGLVAGGLAVVALVALRHRRLGPTFAALAPAGLSVAVTVSMLGLLGIPLDLVGLTALLMVFSMGVDYGVFLAEPGQDPRLTAATFLAVSVAWLSTLAGFGLLALSLHPAMRTIGVIASIGLTTAVLVCPAALVVGERGVQR